MEQLIISPDMFDRAAMMKRLHADRANLANPNAFSSKEKKSILQSKKSSCMYMISVPENLENKTYAGLFKHLARENVLPLGLLRDLPPNTPVGQRGNKMPYVFTNPEKTAEIMPNDKVYVLSMTPMSVSKESIKVRMSPLTG